eukprot:TRINITY_DN11501_c0_g2_i1.p1 TRINITY_DN11501_c0_g2~~TRINITY_DN11501_c0_g2_i1.p1  ORF type:complete len:207 (+),score=38.56 TRINITY_DN11501_c0_g2_i1:659-1279(+)
MGTPVWPANTAIKAVVLDFDKTITVKHTRGAIFQTALLEDKNILINFAHLDFFKRVVPVITSNAKLCIATFADDEEESLLSGKELVRKYLDLAFDGDSKQYIPDNQIIAWNPENRDLQPKVVGKNMHLQELADVLKLKKKEFVLFDDSERNCFLARKKGYNAIDIPEPVRAQDSDDVTGGFSEESWKEFLIEQAKKQQGGGGCSIM